MTVKSMVNLQCLIALKRVKVDIASIVYLNVDLCLHSHNGMEEKCIQ